MSTTSSPMANRSDVIERIPEEVLSAICHETEDRSSSFSSSVTRKCLKNLNILALSQVCRTWRFRLNNNMYLWKDIAFDVCDIRSIKVAGHFLTVMEKTDVLFAVFADLYGDPSYGAGIISRLQPLTGRIFHFEYFGELGECRQYLDRPAGNLHHLSGSPDLDPTTTILSNPLFSGRTPRLRSLAIAAISHCRGWAMPLLHLTRLELIPPEFGHLLLFESLSHTLRGVPSLRDLKLSGLGLIVNASQADRVTLLHLETLMLNQSDVQTVLNHLEMPHLRKITFYGSDHPPGYNAPAPIFQTPHLFSRIPPLRIIEQEIAEVFLMAGEIAGDRRFWLRIVSSCRQYSLDIRMCWCQATASGWKPYVERSMVALQKLLTLSPTAQISLNLQPPFSQPLFFPFSQSPNVHHLTINSGLTEGFSRILALAAIYPPLPQLVRLEIMEASSAPIQDIQMIGSRLYARGIEFAFCTSRGTLLSPTAFDLPDTGYIVFPYLLMFFGRVPFLSNM